jgi:hypothetical protein
VERAIASPVKTNAERLPGECNNIDRLTQANRMHCHFPDILLITALSMSA